MQSCKKGYLTIVYDVNIKTQEQWKQLKESQMVHQGIHEPGRMFVNWFRKIGQWANKR